MGAFLAIISSPVNAAGIVIFRVVDDTPEVLLLFNGRWSPPKGGLESGESHIDGATRETFEESGLSADDYHMNEKYCYSLEYSRKGVVKKIVMFLAQIKNPNQIISISHEHSQFKWMKFDEAVTSRNHPESNEHFALMYKDVFKHIQQNLSL